MNESSVNQEQIELLLRKKYEAGEIDVGLYSIALRYVAMDLVGETLTFTWFGECRSVLALIAEPYGDGILNSRSYPGSAFQKLMDSAKNTPPKPPLGTIHY